MGFHSGSDGKESACNVETQVRFLGWEDPLEKEMATHTSILAWRIPTFKIVPLIFSKWQTHFQFSVTLKKGHLSKSTEYTTDQEWTLTYNSRLWVMVYHCRFTDCNKCTFLVWGFWWQSRGHMRAEGIWNLCSPT